MTEDKELELLNDLFAHEGWKILVDDLQKIYDVTNDLSNINSSDDFYQAQGFIRGIAYVINYKNLLEAQASESP